MFAIFVRYHDSNDGSAIICDGYYVAGIILQKEQIGALSVYCGLKVGTFQTTQLFCVC